MVPNGSHDLSSFPAFSPPPLPFLPPTHLLFLCFLFQQMVSTSLQFSKPTVGKKSISTTSSQPMNYKSYQSSQSGDPLLKLDSLSLSTLPPGINAQLLPGLGQLPLMDSTASFLLSTLICLCLSTSGFWAMCKQLHFPLPGQLFRT